MAASLSLNMRRTRMRNGNVAIFIIPITLGTLKPTTLRPLRTSRPSPSNRVKCDSSPGWGPSALLVILIKPDDGFTITPSGP